MFKSPAALVLGLGIAFGSLNFSPQPLQAAILVAQAEWEYEVGDRLEINRNGQWRSGEVIGVTADNDMRLYRVLYLDVGFLEKDVPASRLRPSDFASQPQTQTADIDLDQPVYVERDGEWLRARILYGIISAGRPAFTVQYHGDRAIEENVPIFRIQNVDVTQTHNASSQAYDLSTQAGIDEMLAAHNYWRSQVGIAPLTWSDELADFAQDWAEELAAKQRMQHNPNNPDFGENLATGTNIFFSPEQVVNLWGNEVADYDYQTNRCAPGKMCGHYTQLVWEETTEVGCGMVRKDNGWEIWVCNYDPPGNYVGERPY
ncbi:CAP domain-containing protein [[Limnothrix rosea] IAM M-220]|uniref:CAP domain-containing protein n=1 Tax=[Limnothrix rosea] IAM M-220 TaxID=454133 RepID=UPI0011154B07|nr:CAP domain-containing protein [[Limnothrix rosea] IAM M-220]